MFRNAYQSGLLSVLYSCGSAPLELWGMEVKNGYIRRVTDEEVKSLALEIAGTNVATTFIFAPKNPKTVLGITLPFLVMIVKNMKRYFTFEITILDDKHMHRRFRISNFHSTTRVRPFCTSMPIGLDDGWHQINFNLSDFTRRAYGSNYLETTRMQIHANCRIRRVYFADRLYANEDLPEEYKLLVPKRQDACVRKENKEDKRPSKPSQARIPVEAVPADEPPPFRVDSRQSEAEEERQTTPLLSAEPSRFVVAPDGASKVRIEIDQEPEDEEAMEHEMETESEADEATTEQEDTAEETAEEQQSASFSPVEEEEETEAEKTNTDETDAKASEGEENEEQEEIAEEQI